MTDAARRPRADAEPPAGFIRFAVRNATVVCANHVADATRRALDANPTLYEFAAAQSHARPLAGRGTAYAIDLGGVERIVVRHNRHGGALARLTGDLFRAPTRAPHELRISEHLRIAGVPTPAMLGYAVYRAPIGFARADVFTREVAGSFDLSEALTSADAELRGRALAATAELLASLATARARHHDINIKNILLHRDADTLIAMVLDVDRVELVPAGADVVAPNLARLLRSAHKWQANYGAPVTDAELAAFVDDVRRRTASTRS
jgi:3-deoxy-D-manno-octulosonic acid kinase